MRRALVLLLALVAVVAGIVGTLGVSDPSRRLTAEEPLWFAAVAGADAVAEPADGVRLRWASTARGTLVGDGPPPFSRFLLLSGEAEGLPVVLGDGVEDAWVARLDALRPPVFVLGTLRALHALGITRRADDDLERLRADGFGADSDPALMPTAEAVAVLAGAPRDFRPAMVNFLAYRDADAYGRYGAVAMRTVYGLGGRLQFAGRVLEVVRPSSRDPGAAWDDVAVMRYPDPTAIFTMERDATYRAALDDRARGLERTRVVISRVEEGDAD